MTGYKAMDKMLNMMETTRFMVVQAMTNSKDISAMITLMAVVVMTILMEGNITTNSTAEVATII